MRDDDTKSHTYEMKLVKEKKEKQHRMLKEQIADERYPKNTSAVKKKEQDDQDEYAKQAQKVAQEEIQEIILQRQERLAKAMTIKSDWDMNVDLNRLKKAVEQRPATFYDNF